MNSSKDNLRESVSTRTSSISKYTNLIPNFSKSIGAEIYRFVFIHAIFSKPNI
ncbi:hypothetical protein HN827_04470 [archaeon]|nr:hypothetical protein [archaeon]MBT4647736.1 hypothetical protein [archaeon]MBT6821264.1 hypothetical protein [archaeon]MBT7392059.1 hypothetical protein [archaeon]